MDHDVIYVEYEMLFFNLSVQTLKVYKLSVFKNKYNKQNEDFVWRKAFEIVRICFGFKTDVWLFCYTVL